MAEREVRAKVAAAIAAIDERVTRAARTSVPRVLIPLVAGAGITTMASACYGVPCEGDCELGPDPETSSSGTHDPSSKV